MKKTLELSALVLLFTACQVEEWKELDIPEASNAHASTPNAGQREANLEALATFAGGCFWCMEKPFEQLPGVSAVISGYTGGDRVNPTYREVGNGTTGHTEAIEIHYAPAVISYTDLLQVLWRQIDATDAGGQFVDRGTQYRSEIFFHTPEQERLAEQSKQELAASGRFDGPIVTAVTPATRFYAAEEYHQDYYIKSADHYHRYRAGSGRDRFIDKVWGADREYVPKGGGVAPWINFAKPSAEELRGQLTSLQYRVTQEEGTERAFSNEYWDNHEAGIYVDLVSGEPLFSSMDKFESGTGWPSFTQPLVPENLAFDTDQNLGYTRREARSRHADSHLGHVFDDGPEPTGLRYCINSAALRFIPKSEMQTHGYGEFLDGVEH